MSEAAKIDANLLLQEWQKQGLEQKIQAEKIGKMLNRANIWVLVVSRQAGKLTGNDKDKTVKEAVKLIKKMSDEDRNQYRRRLIEALHISAAEFNDLLKKTKKSEDEERRREPNFILGGWIKDGEGYWLVEYCYDRVKNRGMFAFRDPQGKIGMAEELVIRDVLYAPVDPSEDLMISKQVVVFPTHVAEESHTTREIAQQIEKFMCKQYLFDDWKMAKIPPYFVMQTWLYQDFNAICYLRAIGDKGSGKSELMRRIGHLCYRLTKASGADSVSTFFRTTTTYGGTVFFEEADLADGSNADNPIIKFINLGAMRGNYILRSDEYIKADGGRGFRTVPFETYCPKIFAQRNDFEDDAVASRSLTIKVIGKSTQELKDAKIPLEMNAAYWRDWDWLSAWLLRWKLEKSRPEPREMNPELHDVMISPRFNQVTAAVKTIAAEDGDMEFLNQVRDVFRALHKDEIIKKSQLTEARIVESLWKMYIYPDLRKRFVITESGEIRIKIGDVTAITNNIIEEMNSEGADLRNGKEDDGGKRKKNFEVGAQKVGKVMREVIQLTSTERSGKGYFIIWDDMKMEIAGLRYGVLPEKEKISEARQAMALMHAKTEVREPLQMAIDTDPKEPEEFSW